MRRQRWGEATRVGKWEVRTPGCKKWRRTCVPKPSSIQRLRPIEFYLSGEHKRWILAPGLPRVTGFTDGLADTAGLGEDRVNWERSGKLLNNMGRAARCSVMMQRGGTREGREVQDGGRLHIILSDSHCCMAEINTTLWSNYPPIKKKSQGCIIQHREYNQYFMITVNGV